MIMPRPSIAQKRKVENKRAAPLSTGSSESLDNTSNSESTQTAMDQNQLQAHPAGSHPALQLNEEGYNNPLFVGQLRDWHREIASLRRHVHSHSMRRLWPKVEACVYVIASRYFPNRVRWTTLDADTRSMMKTWSPKPKKYMDSKPELMLEAWLWRILVEDLFEGPGEQAWEPYATLLHKIQPLTRLTPDEINEDVDEWFGVQLGGRPADWRRTMARRIKGRAMLWRCLTMNLMGIASGTSSRYTVDYVTELVTRKLGRWITPPDEAGQDGLRAALQNLAKSSIEMDWHLHCNHQMFEFQFHDPSTKKACRFPYKRSTGMEVHTEGLDGRDKEGRPVDLIVQPSLFVWGDPSRPVEDWSSVGSGNIGNMTVTVDLKL